MFRQTANLYQQAAAARGADKVRYLSEAGKALSEAAQEARRPQPNQQRINDLLTRARANEDSANPSSSCTIM